MSGEIETLGFGLKTLVCTLGEGIPNKNAGCGFGLEFVICVGPGKRITNAPKFS